MAGDHLDLASIVDGRAQSVVVRKYFSRLRAKTRVLICSGNHDLDAKNEAGEKFAKWLSGSPHEGVLSDGESIVIDGTLFTACPWWDGPIVKAAIGAQLAEASSRRPERWIWIHHAPPAKSPTSWGGDRYFGDVELREWIEQYRPDIVLSGHVHQSPFVKDGSWVDRIGPTWVFNSGQQFGAPPAHIIIDTEVWQRRCGFPLRAISMSASTSRSSGQWRNLRRFRSGSKPRIGLTLRAKREVLVLLVDQGLQHFADHAEMVALSLELPLQVDEIGRRGVETLGEQPAQEKRNFGIGLEKAFSVVEHENADRGCGPDGCRMRPVEQHGHFAENGAGLAEDGHLRIAAQHLDAAFGQDVKPPGSLALGK